MPEPTIGDELAYEALPEETKEVVRRVIEQEALELDRIFGCEYGRGA